MRVNTGLLVVKWGKQDYRVIWLTNGYKMASCQFKSAKKAYDHARWMKDFENQLTMRKAG